MATDRLDDLGHLKRGTALLASCIVQTLAESDPTFRERFSQHLQKTFLMVKDEWDDHRAHELELLALTRDILLYGESAAGAQNTAPNAIKQ